MRGPTCSPTGRWKTCGWRTARYRTLASGRPFQGSRQTARYVSRRILRAASSHSNGRHAPRGVRGARCSCQNGRDRATSLSFKATSEGPSRTRGGGVLAYVRLTAGQPERLSVVQELEGRARAGFFGLSTAALSCQVIKISATPFGIGGIGYYTTQSETRVFALAAQTNGMNLGVTELSNALSPRLITQGMLRGDGIISVEHNAGGIANYVSALRLSDGQVIPGFPGYTKPALRPIPVPGGYFATADEALYFMPSSGEAARLVATPQAGHEIISVDFDQRGAYAMAWLEMNKTTEVATVYTSPFATTAGALQRRAVAKLPTPYPFVFNAGMLLARGAGHTSFRLVRVADGMGWDIAAEPDHASVDPLWVNDDFVWQWVSGNQPGDPGFPTKNVLLKLPRAPLGAPTVSPGL